VVVEEQPYLWAALRQRVDPALAYVRGAGPAEVDAVWRACRPWPWLVVGATPTLPAGLADLLAGRPIPVHWVGPPPPGLPTRPVVHSDWTALVAALDGLRALLDTGVGGVRLLRNRGVQAPDGRIVLDVEHVEGLLAAPGGLPVADGGPLSREIQAGRLPLRLERTGDLLRLA
jgi:hypothetical protein